MQQIAPHIAPITAQKMYIFAICIILTGKYIEILAAIAPETAPIMAPGQKDKNETLSVL